MRTFKMHLLRCGATGAGGYTGQLNPPLSAQGRRELEGLRSRFRYPKVEIAYTSSLDRCVETADILYPEQRIVKLDGLMDLHLGEFQGRTVEELRGEPVFEAWLRDSLRNTPAGGEPLAAFTARIVEAVGQIFHSMMEDGLYSAAVITHGGAILSLLSAIGLPREAPHHWSVGSGCGYTLLFTPQMWMRDGCAEIFAPIPEADEDFFGGPDESWEDSL